jgi:hypothetical protein
MMTIQLQIDRVLQGSFELQDLNLLFVFQVNCPGCFLYGFPLAKKLHDRYREAGLNVLGLSTAFEDFDLNTAANTELLLTQKQTVGATRRSIGVHYDLAIDLPIAIDLLTTGAELATPSQIEFLCKKIAGIDRFSSHEREALRQRMKTYLLRNSQTSATFTLNNLSGTPSFLLVDRHLQLLEGWFGHILESEAIERIEKYLPAGLALRSSTFKAEIVVGL